jgi:hypothetical protein
MHWLVMANQNGRLFKQPLGGIDVSSIRKWLVVTGLAVLQILFAQSAMAQGRYSIEAWDSKDGSVNDPVVTMQQCEWWVRQNPDEIRYVRSRTKTVKEASNWCGWALKAGNADAQKLLDKAKKTGDDANAEYKTESAFWSDSTGAIYLDILRADAKVEANEAKTCALEMEAVVASRGNWNTFYSNAKRCGQSWANLRNKLEKNLDNRTVKDAVIVRVNRLAGVYFECTNVDSCIGNTGTSVYSKVKAQFDDIVAQDAERSAIEWRKKIKVGDNAKEGLILEIKGNLVQVQQKWCNSYGECDYKTPFIPRNNLHPSK